MRLGIRFSIFVIVLQSAMIEFLSESDPSVTKISPEQVIKPRDHEEAGRLGLHQPSFRQMRARGLVALCLLFNQAA